MDVFLYQAPMFAYFDPNLSLCIQFDSSYFGLGVVFLQDGRTIDYQTLSGVDIRFALIEKQILTVLFALAKCNRYTLGRQMMIFSYHHLLQKITTPYSIQQTELHNYGIDLR